MLVSVMNCVSLTVSNFSNMATDAHKCHFHVAGDKRDQKLPARGTPINISDFLYRLHGCRARLHSFSFYIEM